MAKYWVCEVQIPLGQGLNYAIDLGKDLETIAGPSSNAGVGFEYRDIDWVFPNEADAVACQNKLLAYFSENVIPVNDDDVDDEYEEPVQMDVHEYDDEKLLE